MKAADDPTLRRLLHGVKNFQTRFYESGQRKMLDLAEHGQHPEVLVIACSDSRVDPALLMDADPGDLFVVRNVANLVPPYELAGRHDGARAAMEYAVRDLAVRQIVVLGHAHCGGIKALLSSLSGEATTREFIVPWVALAQDACRRYVLSHLSANGSEPREADLSELREHQHLVERAAIRGSLDNLATYPWLKSRLEAGTLHLHGWWIDLETGDLWTADATQSDFLPILD